MTRPLATSAESNRSTTATPGCDARGATTIAVVNFKGGVAKTLTVANLGPALAARGLRVLLVDFDPQADLSASWGIEEDHAGVRVEQTLADPDVDPSRAWVELPVPDGATGRLGLLPAGRALRGQTAQLLEGSALTGVLDPFRAAVDVILVDTPAGESVFGAQALVAADEVLVPVLPGYHEVRALQRVLDEIDRQADLEGTTVGLLGVLFVNAEGRWRTMKAYLPHLGDDEDLGVFETIIERHQPVTDHARWGRPTFLLKRRNRVSRAYEQLAEEVIDRLAARQRQRRSPGMFHAEHSTGRPR